MKKHLLALAALATVSGVAFAQSNVTVYGVVDAGVITTNKTGTTSTPTGSQTTFNNGGMSPSILGFKGTEDLGGGLKANFALEAHMSTDNGKTNQQGDALFGRQSNVGLSGSFGSFTLGRQYTPALLAFAATDPRGVREQFSGLMSWALSGNAATASTTSAINANQSIDVFASKAIAYNTNIAGVNVGAMYGFGGVAGDDSAARQLSFGATYTSGPLTLSGSYQEQNGSTASYYGKVNKKTAVGVGYSFGALTLKANYMNAQAFPGTVSNAKTSETEVYGVGAIYAVDAKNTVTAAYYEGDTKNTANSKARSYILSNDYAFSKRTTLYALVAVADVDSAALAGAIAAQTASATAPAGYVKGASTTSFGVGIKHSF
jgi:predicted porin